MELNFIENENQDWVAEFEATGDFNLHLERDLKGTIIILLKQNEEDEYAFSSEFPNYYKIFNYDFAALLYPKYIKVISDSKVIKGSVNFNEGGGSGSGSGEASTVEYWSMNWDIYNSLESSIKQTILRSIILGSSELSKTTMNGIVEIKNSGAVLFMDMFSDGSISYSIMAISYNKMVNITTDSDKQLSFEEVLLECEAQVEGITDCFSRITKEQFYNLEA